MNIDDQELKELLLKYKQFCVYGLSPNKTKPSHYVPIYMRDHGWDIVGVYPKAHDVEVFKIYTSLKDIPIEHRKFLDVFRASDKIPELVDEVIAVGGVEVLWLQLGISHPQAQLKAQNAGIKVISDRCLIIEHQRLF
jgi:predicted CoA-binding protein